MKSIALLVAVLLSVSCASVSRTAAPLRVCSDPNNLPFSNARGAPDASGRDVAHAASRHVLAAGARGSAAIYTEHLSMLHILRKVLLRVASYLDYAIIKHNISLGH